jgi:hypothetical protein
LFPTLETRGFGRNTLGKIDDGKKVSDGMRQEATDAVAKLLKQGVDVEGLFARREEVRQLRTQRPNAEVPELNGQTLRLPGYVLPLEYEGKKVTEFLLAPWVGAYWIPVGDGQFRYAAVGAIALHKKNPDIMYVGLGEPQMRQSVSWGDGMYKTVDGGEIDAKIAEFDAQLAEAMQPFGN